VQTVGTENTGVWVNPMCSFYEQERKEDRAEEAKEKRRSDKIHNALKGQLSYTTEEWLRKSKEEYIQ
jgi:hypothetical protein